MCSTPLKTTDLTMDARRLSDRLHVEIRNLRTAPLEDLIEALSAGLKNYFEAVLVEVVQCPDLTLPPFNLSAKGLSGGTAVVQIGDPAYVVPVTLKNKMYDFLDVAKVFDLRSSFIIGAGGGNWCTRGTLVEMFTDVITNENSVRNHSKYTFSKTKFYDGLISETADPDETKFSTLANFFVSSGEPGKVIKIHCKNRIGKEDFPSSIISTLNENYDFPLAFGCIFQMRQGKAKHHIPPYFAEGVQNTEDWRKWVLFTEIPAPFLAIGTLLTCNPPGWGMTLQHFHSFNGNMGGHYHGDVTPEEAEYVAYMAPAERLCSIDKAANPLSLLNYDCHDAPIMANQILTE